MRGKVFSALTALILYIFTTATYAVTPSGDLTLLVAKDKTRVYASYYRALNNNPKIAILFHQADSNRMEYEPLLSTFHIAGFDTLTVDLRSGGDKWGFENTTVKRLGKSTEYAEAYPDMEAALQYAIKRKYKEIMLVGSSYSASLAIVLASQHPDKVVAVAAFSPGEYFPNKNWIKHAASKLNVPLFVSGATSEQQRVTEVLINTSGKDVTLSIPLNSVPGASTFRPDQNPEGYKSNQAEFAKFVERFK
jgi:pimeloyl-ACP methyl ester carboxylesterase